MADNNVNIVNSNMSDADSNQTSDTTPNDSEAVSSSNIETNNNNDSPNVNFVTRVLHENNNQVSGVEILIYGDENTPPIKQILVTDKNEFDSWMNAVNNNNQAYVPFSEEDLIKLEELRIKDQAYQDGTITKEEYEEYINNIEWSVLKTEGISLEKILKNEIDISTNNYLFEINATKFMGMESDEFSKVGHTHNFAPLSHISADGKYGIGNDSNFGHVKVIDNLNTNLSTKGNALSAYQGFLLDSRLKILEEEKKFSWSNPIKLNSLVSYSINEGLHLIAFDLHYPNCTGFKNKATIITLDDSIPSQYAPTQACISSASRGDVTVYVNTTGAIKIRSLTKLSSTNINVHMLWHYK